MRHRTAGSSSNLFEAMILEGLADHFSVEVASVGPPIWATALSDEQLATWLERSREEWFNSSYSHNVWFFGAGEVPRWAGYTIGFELVRVFLEANPGLRPSGLYTEPAASFLR